MEEVRSLIIQAFNKAIEQGVILHSISFEHSSRIEPDNCVVRLLDVGFNASIKPTKTSNQPV